MAPIYTLPFRAKVYCIVYLKHCGSTGSSTARKDAPLTVFVSYIPMMSL